MTQSSSDPSPKLRLVASQTSTSGHDLPTNSPSTPKPWSEPTRSVETSTAPLPRSLMVKLTTLASSAPHRLHGLEALVDVYQNYKEAVKQMAELGELSRGGDKEMAELAQLELPEKLAPFSLICTSLVTSIRRWGRSSSPR